MSAVKVTFLKARNVSSRRFKEGESEDFDEGTANLLINGGWAKRYGDPDPEGVTEEDGDADGDGQGDGDGDGQGDGDGDEGKKKPARKSAKASKTAEKSGD